jgi:rhombotail lipoprotein
MPRPALWGCLAVVLAACALSGCRAMTCSRQCHSSEHNSSSLVDFLYPGGALPPVQDARPTLRVPLRVGLAFLPAQNPDAAMLSAAQQEQLLTRIRQHFLSRTFVADIVIIPDYYLRRGRGYDGLAGVQRLYGVDVMALVSYDQAVHLDDNGWSLGYLTIVGAFVLRGSSHDISTLIDLAVVDPLTHSLVIRAGGVDIRRGNATLISDSRVTREAGGESFSAATDQMIGHFDTALVKLEDDVRAGRSDVHVVSAHHSDSGAAAGGGGGALGALDAAALLLVLAVRRIRNGRPRTGLAAASACQN